MRADSFNAASTRGPTVSNHEMSNYRHIDAQTYVLPATRARYKILTRRLLRTVIAIATSRNSRELQVSVEMKN